MPGEFLTNTVDGSAPEQSSRTAPRPFVQPASLLAPFAERRRGMGALAAIECGSVICANSVVEMFWVFLCGTALYRPIKAIDRIFCALAHR